tara:strand:+ start:209 stop:553 length:345 start_codon:yes stop_codon:yes gene_type:complete
VKEDPQNQRNNPQKSQGSSGDQRKTVRRKRTNTNKKTPFLNKLILITGCAIVVFVGLNFISCNFMLPGSIQHANSLGLLKNPPPTDCKESERRGYEVLITLLTTVIALKTRMED